LIIVGAFFKRKKKKRKEKRREERTVWPSPHFYCAAVANGDDSLDSLPIFMFVVVCSKRCFGQKGAIVGEGWGADNDQHHVQQSTSHCFGFIYGLFLSMNATMGRENFNYNN
jgi:hypothetical protein